MSFGPGYDRQNDLNEVLSRLMQDAQCTDEEREYVLATAAAALMETYQHGYWDGSNNLGSKVKDSDTELHPSERDLNDDWFERASWGDDGGPVSA